MPSSFPNPSGSLPPAPLTPRLEAEIRARRATVTDSPWGSSCNGADEYTVQAGAWVSLTEGFTSSGDVANVLGDDGETRYRRASFIARSPRDIDTLLAEVDRLRGELAELQNGPSANAALLEAKAEVVAWLDKKAGEHRRRGRQYAKQADVIETLASKVERGAIRTFLAAEGGAR